MAELPKGEGKGSIAEELGKTNAQVFGLIGKQQQQINQMNKSLDRLANVITLGDDIANDLLSQILTTSMDLTELFQPVARHFQELGEGQGDIQPAAAASVNYGSSGGDEKGDVKEVEGAKKQGNFLLDLIKGLTTGIAGLIAGVGGAIGGLGLGALGLGARALAPGLAAMANPAVAIGGVVLLGFLGGLAGVAYLSGMAMEKIGEGFTGLGQGLNDLAAAEMPDGQQLEALATALGVLFASIDTSDAIKTAILDGTAFSDMATGLEDLANAEFTPQAIDSAAGAIANFFDQVGIGDAIKSQILTGDAFGTLATGLQSLNDIDVDSERLKAAGTAVNSFLGEIGFFRNIGGSVLTSIFDYDFVQIASSIAALQSVNADVEKVKNAGMALKEFTLQADEIDISGTLLAKFQNREMYEEIADGLRALNSAGGEIDINNINKVSTSLIMLVNSLGDQKALAGVRAVEMIDDNLKPFAEGIGYIGDIGNRVNEEDYDKFVYAGTAMQQAMDIPLGTAITVQMIDDNLIPFAEGVKKVNDISAGLNPDNFKNLTGALNEFRLAFLGEDGEDNYFFGDDFKIPLNYQEIIKLQNLAGALSTLSTVGRTDGLGRVGGGIQALVAGVAELKDMNTDFSALDTLKEKLTDLASFEGRDELAAVLEGINGVADASGANLAGMTRATEPVNAANALGAEAAQQNAGININTGGYSQVVDAKQITNNITKQTNQFSSPLNPKACWA